MPLDFELFHDFEYGGQGITRSWVSRARRIRPGDPQEDFDRFTAVWTAFNAWGMCVSLAQNDRAMLLALAADGDVTATFDRVIQNGHYTDEFEAFASSFPLPNFSDLLRINPRFNWRGPRDETYWAQIVVPRRIDKGYAYLLP